MTTYVDDVRHRFGRMIMCHLWSDTTEELHTFAQSIGIERRWFQHPPKASWEHYDISLSKKALAIRRGALLTDRYGPVEHTAWLTNRWGMIATIYDIRARDGRPLDGIIRGKQP